VKLRLWEKVRAELFPPTEPAAETTGRSDYERLAIPHTFKPQLSLIEAIIAAFGAFLRIFLGSLLFAVWGTYTLFAWAKLGNYFWRVVAMVPLTLLFLLTFTFLMLAISAAVRTVSPKPR
jgi:hypothetical protein